MDNALADGLGREIGHGPPYTDDELARVTTVHIAHARDISALADCPNLRIVILIGCEAGDLAPLSGHDHLESVRMEMSTLRDVSSLGGAPRLVGLSLANNMLQDASPLLECPQLVQLDVTGNPLSDRSYHEVLTQLRGRHCLVTAPDERTLRLTRRLQADGHPASFYQAAEGTLLCPLGLTITPLPEFGHVRMEPDELEVLLDQGTLDLHALFPIPEGGEPDGA